MTDDEIKAAYLHIAAREQAIIKMINGWGRNAKTQTKPVLRTVSVSTAAGNRQESNRGFPVLLEKF